MSARDNEAAKREPFYRAARDAIDMLGNTAVRSDQPLIADFIYDALTAAGYRILAKEDLEKAERLLTALERQGFPVSEAATPQLMAGGSREAKELHLAAIEFRTALRSLSEKTA